MLLIFMIIIVFSLVGFLNKTNKEKVKLELSNNLSIEGYEVSKDNIYILEKGDYKIINKCP